MQRDGRIDSLVLSQLLAEVVVAEDVAVQHDHRLVRSGVQLRRNIADTPARAERFELGDAFDIDAGWGVVSGVRRKNVRTKRRGENDVTDTGNMQPLELVLDERPAGNRQQRLRRRDREWAKSGALAAHQDDRVDCGAARYQRQPAIARL